MDSSIKAPGASRRMFNAPELGVIPNLGTQRQRMAGQAKRPRKPKTWFSTDGHDDPATALATWQSGPAFIAESFRGTLASILRNQAPARPKR